MQKQKKENGILNLAYQIAVRDLRLNCGELGIYAGPNHHHEYWGRDSFFASFGSCALGDFEIVRKNLDSFKKYQAKNGQIPIRIEERSHAWHALGIDFYHKKPKALFKQSMPWGAKLYKPAQKFNNEIKKATAKLKNEEYLITGHTHLAEIDLKNRFVNTGFIHSGVASYVVLENCEPKIVNERYDWGILS